MPEYYLMPKKAGRAFPALGRAAIKVEAWVFRFLFWLLGLLSPERASWIAAWFFGLFGPRSPMAQKVCLNLSIAFPEKSDEEIKKTTHQVFRQLGMALAELINMRQIWDEREQRMQFVIDPAAQAHFNTKSATVFVTAHVGAWQLTNLISLHQNLTITTVYAAESNPLMHSMMYQLREAFGVKLLPVQAGVRPLLRELNQGNSIGLAMDTRLDSGEPLPFFGVDALTNTTAARLALRTGAALIPIRAERLRPGYFKISVMAPITSPKPQDSANNQASAMTGLINKHFEQWIKGAPHQWMCLKRRWPKAPKE